MTKSVTVEALNVGDVFLVTREGMREAATVMHIALTSGWGRVVFKTTQSDKTGVINAHKFYEFNLV